MRYTQEQIEKSLTALGFKIYPDKLNIVAVRENNDFDDTFNDKIYVWRNDNNGVPFTEYNITTKAGRYWVQTVMNAKGVAAVVENQYEDAWVLGKHKGQYEALVQAKPILVYRDGNKDLFLNTAKTEKGIFGINIHASIRRFLNIKFSVGKWSAGCLVFSLYKEYLAFIKTCKESGQKTFTLTLINKKIIDKFGN